MASKWVRGALLCGVPVWLAQAGMAADITPSGPAPGGNPPPLVYPYGTNYDYLSRNDAISLSAGDAVHANIVIQTPTPWPRYVNRTNIPVSARLGTTALELMYKAAASTDQVPRSEGIKQVTSSNANSQ
jgi:hypothetical protein